MTRAQPCCLVLFLACLIAAPGSAQLLESTMPVTVRAAPEALGCEAGGPCSQSNWLDATGRAEFRVYQFGGNMCEASFDLEYPEDWSYVDARICQGVGIEGNVENPRAGLVIRRENEPFDPEVPLLTLVLDCPSPGMMRLSNRLGEGDIVADCRTGVRSPSYVGFAGVGEYCGKIVNRPCNLVCPPRIVGEFAPSALQLTLEALQIWTDTLLVRASDECFAIPECHLGSACYDGVSARVPWITLTLVRETGFEHFFRLTVDPSTLERGRHETRIDMLGLPDCCADTCMELTLDVIPPSPVQLTTWGRIKTRY